MSRGFVCTNCSFASLKWLGKCPNCSEWNTFKEQPQSLSPQSTPTGKASTFSNTFQGFDVASTNQQPIQLEQIYTQLAQQADSKTYKKDSKKDGILAFHTAYLNDFWNKGVLSDSLTLLAGEPGLGKSTFALQILRDLMKQNSNLETLYISAEESILQLAQRAMRLDIPAAVQVLHLNNLENIIEIVASKVWQTTQKADQKDTPATCHILVIDSIQTIYSSQASGSPGSISQVTFIVNQLLNLSKSAGIAIILIGHVTKTGDIAGPKTLEHMVDSVLLLEQPQHSSKFRSLSFSKHRFGTTDKILFLEMAEKGLNIIKNPSLVLLENLETGVGISYALALDHNQPLLVEIQALVHQTGAGFGRHEANGLTNTKLNILVALLEKYLQLDLKNFDIYVQILGLPKNLVDENLDLAICLAILSSLRNLPLAEIFAGISVDTKQLDKTVYCARLTLSGVIRPATSQKIRAGAAALLGFGYNHPLDKLKRLTELIDFIGKL